MKIDPELACPAKLLSQYAAFCSELRTLGEDATGQSGKPRFRKKKLQLERQESAGDFLDTKDLICLRSLGALDDVKLDLISLFQTLVTIPLDGGVVDEDIGSAISAKKTVSLCIVEPLYDAFVLCQDPAPYNERFRTCPEDPAGRSWQF